MKRLSKVVWLLAFVAGFGVFAVAPAAAQTSAGIRAGLSVNPDQSTSAAMWKHRRWWTSFDSSRTLRSVSATT
jgi:uncharacterized membrane protein YesL